MKNDVRIVHFIPGRVRFKTEQIKQSAEFAHAVETRLSGLAGVRRVTVNRETGSVLVTYDSKAIAEPQNQQAINAAITALFPSLDVEKLRRYL